jgi:hypothetical protein
MHRWRHGGAFLIGCAALGLIAGCSGGSSASKSPPPIARSVAAASPEPVAVDPLQACIWPEDLTFSGAFPLNVSKTDCDSQEFSCAGKNAAGSSSWSAHLPFYHSYIHNHLLIDVHGFHGPGAYDEKAASVAVVTNDLDPVRGQNNPGDTVAFTIDSTLESGTLDATLTSNQRGSKRVLNVSGKWSCRTTT